MGKIRPLVRDDLPRIAELHEQVFGQGTQPPPSLVSYLEKIFLQHPWYDDALTSLVYEDSAGKITGCIGVMPHQMSMQGRPIRVAISHTFMVEPSSRSSLAGTKLLKHFFGGPQDLSLAQGHSNSRKLWEALGGETSLLYGIHWTRPLRPAHLAISVLRKRKQLAPLALISKPIARIFDGLAARIPASHFRLVAPRLPGEDISVETMLAQLPELTRGRSLRPEYDLESLQWLFTMLRQKQTQGTLRSVAVRDPEHSIVGWYVYYVQPGGVSQVVQFTAKPASVTEVLRHLFYDAWQRGAIALVGQVDPKYIETLSNNYCLFHCEDSWVLVQSRHPEILRTIHKGDAFLTRLDGEWWLSVD